MDAIVSGSAGRAAFIEGDEVTYIEASDPDRRIKSTMRALPILFGDAIDVVRIPNAEAGKVNTLLQTN